jgi:hypothetical protein
VTVALPEPNPTNAVASGTCTTPNAGAIGAEALVEPLSTPEPTTCTSSESMPSGCPAATFWTSTGSVTVAFWMTRPKLVDIDALMTPGTR